MSERKMRDAFGYFYICTSLSRLREQENDYQLLVVHSRILQDHISSLKYGLQFLECFLRFSENRCLKLQIQRVANEVSLELESISNRSVTQVELELAYASLLKKLSTIKVTPETVSNHISVSFPRKGLYFNAINAVLVQSLGDMKTIKPNLLPDYLLKDIEGLKEKLLLFKPLFNFLAEVYIGFDHSLVVLLREVACISYACFVDQNVVVASVKTRLEILLWKIDIKEIYMKVVIASPLTVRVIGYDCKLLKNVICLLHCNSMHLSLQGVELLKELRLFQAQIYALDPELKREKNKMILLEANVEYITRNAIPILYSSNDLEMERERSELDQTLSRVREHIKHTLSQFGELKLHKHPKTDPFGFLEVFCSNLEELRVSRRKLIETMNNEIDVLHLYFDQLRSFFSIPESLKEHNNLWLRFTSLAYDAEYVIDLFLVNGLDPRIKPSVCRILDNVQQVKMKLLGTNSEDFKSDKGDNVVNTQVNLGETLSSVSSRGSMTTTSDFVGLQDEQRKIMESIVLGPRELDVVSIVGMPGLGKTTLANKVYDDPSVGQHFDIRVWCMVSQTYSRSELCLNILLGLGFNINDFCKKDDTDEEEGTRTIVNDDVLVEKIAQNLKRRRYLIVFDDMWDVKAWKELRSYLPDDHCGSRVLITTRIQNVAAETTFDSSNVHALRPLFENESLALFESKLGTRESYSHCLLQVGHRIALSCKGLPLAIVVIAGLLSKEKRSVEKWEEIAKSLNSHILSDLEKPYRAMLELSYNHLPDYLKPCFQYIGALGANIPVKKLKRLWIAEGFVRHSRYTTLERVAEEYLMDLISRSLLTLTERRVCGGVKSCRAHDLIYDFCKEKSEEENFMHNIHMSGWSELLKPYDQYRVCMSLQGHSFQEPLCSGHRVRSLLYFSEARLPPHAVYDVSFLGREFKILRVLDLACINIGRSLDKMKPLIHLKYLAVYALLTSIPSSISCLRNLQTLLVEATRVGDGTNETVVDVPLSLWDMVNLRNVHIDHLASFQVEGNRPEHISFATSIESLSTPCLSSSEDTEKLLKGMQKLQKLRCAFRNSTNGSMGFPALDFLTQLTSLRVSWVGSSPTTGQPHEFKFPSNLKKLTLEGFSLRWDEMSNLGRNLPHLEALKILKSGFGETWHVSDEDFLNLKYLKLSGINSIGDWIASEDSFPMLEHLHIEDCRNIMELPPRFEDAPCLRMITVLRCNYSLDDSARSVGQKQKEEAQVEDFIINIL